MLSFSTIPRLVSVGIACLSVSYLALTDGSPALARFDFHDGFWLNLHLALYQRGLPANADHEPAEDDPDWTQAVSYYRANMSSKDLLFDEGLVILKETLEDQEHTETLQPARNLSAVLVEYLQKAARPYRDHLWPKQKLANDQWIQHLRPLLDRYGGQISMSLSSAYQTAWPQNPIRVDVTNYASWAGAYTTNGPTRITISSIDPANQGDAALEVLFHEASHGISDKLEHAISTECKQQNVLLPRRDLWHAVLFYTTGEIVRRALPNYTPYAAANGLWKRAWPMYVDPLERHWKPYLESKISFGSAVATIVKEVGKPKEELKP